MAAWKKSAKETRDQYNIANVTAGIETAHAAEWAAIGLGLCETGFGLVACEAIAIVHSGIAGGAAAAAGILSMKLQDIEDQIKNHEKEIERLEKEREKWLKEQ